MQQDGFAGRIGRTRDESQPYFAPRPAARAGAPNIVILYMDDMGWSDPGCFGSEIDTPHLHALAAEGLRFNHYTSHPICSPARAALLTGRNAHAVGTGWLANNHAGYPGYSGEIPLQAPTLAETLRAAGYATFMVGKWHNTPAIDVTPAGNKRSWPVQRGFERFHGILEGETSFFFPAFLRDDNQVIPIDQYPPDYYTTDAWTDQGMRFVRELRASSADKPFLLYLAFNAVHAPLQAHAADIAKYRGRYDAGWGALRAERHARQIAMGLIPPGTALPASDPRVPDWDATDPADRPMLARHMEVYAAMLDRVDQNIGRLLAFLEEIGERENTIILFSSDNGGTDGGGPLGMYNNAGRYMGLGPLAPEEERALADDLGSARSIPLYPTGWGEVSNTPFPTYKTYTGGGGRRVSFLVSWPARIRDGGAVREQFVHVTDVMPTLLDCAGVAPLATINGAPAERMDGRSFAPLLTNPAAPSPRTEQYYECWSNRGFYRDGWLARSIQARGEPIDMDNWTLHELTRDFSESRDVAGEHPQKLAELVTAFDEAAWKYFVYPLDNRTRTQKFGDARPDQRAVSDRPRRYWPGAQTTHRGDIMPLIANRSFTIAVRFTQRAGDQGVLWAIGDPTAGIVMYVEQGLLRLHYNGFGRLTDLPDCALPDGAHEAVLDYEATGNRQGRGRIILDGVAGEWAPLSPTLVGAGIFEGLDIGLDRRGPACWRLHEQYGVFRYPGPILDVEVTPGARPG